MWAETLALAPVDPHQCTAIASRSRLSCSPKVFSSSTALVTRNSSSYGWLRDLFSTAPLSSGPPLSRGSDGRFGLRRFRAKLTPTPFGTHRAFAHALPPSFGFCSVPFTVPPCFFPLPLK